MSTTFYDQRPVKSLKHTPEELAALLDMLHLVFGEDPGYSVRYEHAAAWGEITVLFYLDAPEQAQSVADRLGVTFTAEPLATGEGRAFEGERDGVHYVFLATRAALADLPDVIEPVVVTEIPRAKRGRGTSPGYDKLFEQAQARAGTWVLVGENRTGAGAKAMAQRGCRVRKQHIGDIIRVWAMWGDPIDGAEGRMAAAQ